MAERPDGALVGVGFVRARAGCGVALRGRRVLGGASAHSSRPSSRVQATCRRFVGALRVGSWRAGRPSSASSRLRVTSRAPRRATLPHCLALDGSGCSSSKSLRRGRAACLDAESSRPGERRGLRSGRPSRRADCSVWVRDRPKPAPVPVLVRLRSRRSSLSRWGGRFPPERRVDDGDREPDSGREPDSDRLRPRVPDGRPVRDEVLDAGPDDDPRRAPPVPLRSP